MSGAVLVVDDDDDIRAIVSEVLVDHGYRTIAAADGAEALRALTSVAERGELPGLVLLDWMMPRMDGGAFCRACAREERLASVPIVVMTASGEAEKQRANLPLAAIVRKPLTLDRLLDVVRTHYRAANETGNET